MKMLQDKKLRNAKLFLKKLPWLIGERLFISILISFLICLLAAGLIFYRYAWKVKDVEPSAQKTSIKFKKDAFQSLTEEWAEREAAFQTAQQKEYPNPFE